MKYSVMTLDLRGSAGTVSELQLRSVCEMVRWYDPDIVCIRNLEDAALKHLTPLTTNYRFYGGGCSVGKSMLRSCILHRRGMFIPGDGTTLSMRTSPLRLPCVITALTLVHGEDRLRVICAAANRPGGQRIITTIEGLAQEPAIVCGDLDDMLFRDPALMNVHGSTPQLKDLLRSGTSRYRPYDRIYADKKLSVLHSEAVESLFMGVLPSRRVPVYCELEL